MPLEEAIIFQFFEEKKDVFCFVKLSKVKNLGTTSAPKYISKLFYQIKACKINWEEKGFIFNWEGYFLHDRLSINFYLVTALNLKKINAKCQFFSTSKIFERFDIMIDICSLVTLCP